MPLLSTPFPYLQGNCLRQPLAGRRRSRVRGAGFTAAASWAGSCTPRSPPRPPSLPRALGSEGSREVCSSPGSQQPRPTALAESPLRALQGPAGGTHGTPAAQPHGTELLRGPRASSFPAVLGDKKPRFACRGAEENTFPSAHEGPILHRLSPDPASDVNLSIFPVILATTTDRPRRTVPNARARSRKRSPRPQERAPATKGRTAVYPGHRGGSLRRQEKLRQKVLLPASGLAVSGRAAMAPSQRRSGKNHSDLCPSPAPSLPRPRSPGNKKTSLASGEPSLLADPPAASLDPAELPNAGGGHWLMFAQLSPDKSSVRSRPLLPTPRSPARRLWLAGGGGGGNSFLRPAAIALRAKARGCVTSREP